MTRTTTTVLGPDGAPHVRHRTGPGPAADALRHEAEVLALARGTGVVELVEATDEPDGGAALVTRYVAGGTLANLARTEGTAAALAALAEVARTLARLHDLGIVHGRCTAEHVVGRPGAVVLCGFSAARTTGDDGAAPDPTPDLEAFATLVASTVPADDDRGRRAGAAAARLTGPPGPGRDLRAVAAELDALAGATGTAGAAATPTGRRLLPSGDRRRPSSGDRLGTSRTRHAAGLAARSRRRRLAGMAVAAVVVTGAVAGTAGLTRSGDGSPNPVALRSEPPTSTTAAPTADAASTSDEATTASPPTTGRPAAASGEPVTAATPPATAPPAQPTAPPPPTTASPAAATAPPPETTAPPTTSEQPAAGPEATNSTSAGGDVPAGVAVLDHGGARFAVGAPGDLVAVGDWDCDGTATPAVVRPADGTAWAFAGWADGTDPVSAEPLGTVAAPAAVEAVPGGEGCDLLAVTTAEGDQVVLGGGSPSPG